MLVLLGASGGTGRVDMSLRYVRSARIELDMVLVASDTTTEFILLTCFGTSSESFTM